MYAVLDNIYVRERMSPWKVNQKLFLLGRGRYAWREGSFYQPSFPQDNLIPGSSEFFNLQNPFVESSG